MTVKNKKIITKILKISGFIIFTILFLALTITLLYFKYDQDLGSIFKFENSQDIYIFITSVISSLSISSLLWIAIFRIVKLCKRKK